MCYALRTIDFHQVLVVAKEKNLLESLNTETVTVLLE